MRIGIIGSMQLTEAMYEIRDKLKKLDHDAYLTDLAKPFIGKTDEEKERMSSLLGSIGDYEPPVDPSGSPSYQMDDCMKWIEGAERNSKHFGDKGLNAFIKTHHQNCDGICFETWEDVNIILLNCN